MKDRICTSCGYVGKPISQCPESFLVDAMIWLTIGSFSLMTGLLPFLVIPMAWTVYHIAKYRTTKCPKCENLSMVSQDSSKGRTMANRDNSRASAV